MKKVVLSVVVLSLLLTGCWDMASIESLDIISLMGFDTGDDENINVILQELAPSKQQTGGPMGRGGGGADQKPFHTYTESGKTVYEAVQKVYKKQAITKLYFAHLRAVIISEKLARSDGINDILDFLLREPQVRRRVWLLIARNGELDQLMNTDFGLGVHTGRMINEMLFDNRWNILQPAQNISDFVRVIENPGNEAFTAGIYMVPKKQSDESKKSGGETEKYDMQISETAVFHKTKMVGWLDDTETKGLLWARGKIKGGIFELSSGEHALSMQVLRMSSEIKPEYINGTMQIHIQVDAETIVNESGRPYDFSKSEVVDEVRSMQNEEIKKEILLAVKKTKELDADILQFGGKIFDKYPKYWLRIADNWDAMYREIPVRVDVESSIRLAGIIKRAGFIQKTYKK